MQRETNQHQPWEQVPARYCLIREQETPQRWVMFMDERGATVLGPWHGPHCTAAKCGRARA